MRNLVGCVALVAGVGGLGWYASANTAETIQTQVTERAASVASASMFEVQTNVSGRDISASGVVLDQAEFDSLLAAFNDVDGRRVVDMSAITILPVADPFVVTASRTEQGDVTLSGATPSEAARAAFAGVAGSDLADQLVWSSGAPRPDWPDVATTSYGAFTMLKSGEMTLSDLTLTMRGLAATPTERDAVLAVLADLPDAYTVESMIDVEDDGTPLRLSLALRDGGLALTGKFPPDLSMADIADPEVLEGDSAVVQSTVPAFDPDWADVARTSANALSGLTEGQLDIEGLDVRLSGVATPDAKALAETMLAGLPAQYSVTTDIGLFDDGLPFTLDMAFDGTAATAQGKYPDGFTVPAPNGAPLSDTGTTAFIGDDSGAFATNAAAGVAALGLLQNGTLQASETDIVLTGVALSPADDAAINAALAAAGDGVNVQTSLTYLDDGTPPAWSLDYSADTGARVGGKLPSDLGLDALADALDVGSIDGAPAVSATQPFEGDALDVLSITAGYLPEIEQLAYRNEAGTQSLDLVLAPGVNVDLVAADLAERLPNDVAFSAQALTDLPQQGAMRTNQATMTRERFQFGNWLPILTFAPVPAICADQSQAALDGPGVNFLSGSAQLDAQSIRAINALAAITQRCVEDGGLTLEVGGHTDSTGSEIANQLLSENRANAVRTALVDRGVNPDAITATGFGQTQPIADNATEDGRASNRRTTITWSQ